MGVLEYQIFEYPIGSLRAHQEQPLTVVRCLGALPRPVSFEGNPPQAEAGIARVEAPLPPHEHHSDMSPFSPLPRSKLQDSLTDAGAGYVYPLVNNRDAAVEDIAAIRIERQSIGG